MNESTIDRTYRALDRLRGYLPDLRSALVPGSRRRWSQHDLTPEQREQRDLLAREERAAKDDTLRRGLVVLGGSPAPLVIRVLVALDEIDAGVAGIEATVCEWLGLTPLAGTTTVVRITRVVSLLDRVAAYEELAGWLAAEMCRLSRVAARALDDVEPIRRLDGRCPYCHAKSLRALPEREVVVCVNAACQCDDDMCVCRADRPRCHAWPFAEWPGLAAQLADVVEVAV